MAEGFLKRAAIVDLVKGEHRANALRRRAGLTRHPLIVIVYGCPDPNCGGSCNTHTGRTIPTAVEADATLAADKATRKASDAADKAIHKASERVRRANAARKKRASVATGTAAG